MSAADPSRGPVFTVASPSPAQLRLTARRSLDLATEDQARRELATALDGGRTRSCEVDVSAVFVDVRGLAVLEEATRRLRSAGGQLVVVPGRSLSRLHSILQPGADLVLRPGRSVHLDVPHAR